jgi:hypothetical protein
MERLGPVNHWVAGSSCFRGARTILAEPTASSGYWRRPGARVPGRCRNPLPSKPYGHVAARRRILCSEEGSLGPGVTVWVRPVIRKSSLELSDSPFNTPRWANSRVPLGLQGCLALLQIGRAAVAQWRMIGRCLATPRPTMYTSVGGSRSWRMGSRRCGGLDG